MLTQPEINCSPLLGLRHRQDAGHHSHIRMCLASSDRTPGKQHLRRLDGRHMLSCTGESKVSACVRCKMYYTPHMHAQKLVKDLDKQLQRLQSPDSPDRVRSRLIDVVTSNKDGPYHYATTIFTGKTCLKAVERLSGPKLFAASTGTLSL